MEYSIKSMLYGVLNKKRKRKGIGMKGLCSRADVNLMHSVH